MSKSKKAVIVGASGLVGKALLDMLLKDADYAAVLLLVRRELPFSHPKLVQKVIDFRRIIQLAELVEGYDVGFCCLGTTMKQVNGEKAAFYEVDYTFCARFGELCEKCGVAQFVIVSAMGADEKSVFYYNRVKGQTENFIRKLVFDAVYIFRPSLLLGNRSEKRSGEDFGKSLMNTFSFLIPEKYKGVEALKVAQAMRLAVQSHKKGIFVIESAAIKNTPL